MADARVLTVHAWSAHLPGLDPAACRPEAAATMLGRRGLLGKDDATRLALCAVHRALDLDDGVRPVSAPDPGVAVVGCGNLGNVDTVADVARRATANGVREISPLAAPRASSNVMTSVVAIWFRLGGPNLMICSGATASFDALATAELLLRARRARQVVVVGAEADTPTATALYGRRRRLAAGAACVIVGPEPPTAGIGIRLRLDGPAAPAGAPAAWGDCYGAQGLIGVAEAAGRVRAGAGPVEVSCGDEADGYRSVTVLPLPATPGRGREAR